MIQPMKRRERTSFPHEDKRPSSGTQQRVRMPSLQVGNEIDVTIEEIGHRGDGVAHAEGFTVFVKGATVGHRLRVKVTKVMKTLAWAEKR